MKNLKLIYVVLATVILGSCSQQDNYPKYRLTTIQYVPDSLKSEYSKFITETVRAASQQMNGGDYEDVDETSRKNRV